VTDAPALGGSEVPLEELRVGTATDVDWLTPAPEPAAAAHAALAVVAALAAARRRRAPR
jgi:hypothetical protein